MRVPVEELVDLEQLAEGGGEPSARSIREALPRGWVLEPDGRTARRDLRVMAREGWLLLLAMLAFGSIVAGLFWHSFPPGAAGLMRFGLLVLLVVVTGGLIAPSITRALYRK